MGGIRARGGGDTRRDCSDQASLHPLACIFLSRITFQGEAGAPVHTFVDGFGGPYTLQITEAPRPGPAQKHLM